MRRIIYLIIIAISFIAFEGVAQTTVKTVEQKQIEPSAYTIEHIVVLNYNMGFTSGNTKDFIEKASFRGFGFEYRRVIKNIWSVGFSVDWQRFYESLGKQTVDFNESTLYGSQFNYINSVPLMVTGHYYFMGVDDDLITFVGSGIGTYYNELYTDIGSARFYSDSWQFGLAPEAGLIYNVGYEVGISAAVRYNYGFETSSLDAQSYWTIRVGIAWLF
jgi:opacity protein-like surface antigen